MNWQFIQFISFLEAKLRLSFVKFMQNEELNYTGPWALFVIKLLHKLIKKKLLNSARL